MKSVRISLIVLTLAVLVEKQPLQAKAWSLADLNPFAKKDTKTAPRGQLKAPSPWQRIDTGTKQFFTKTKDVLTLKKPEKKNNPSLWNRRPKRPTNKKPFWSSWFKPKKPGPPKSMEEWWQLKRMDP